MKKKVTILIIAVLLTSAMVTAIGGMKPDISSISTLSSPCGTLWQSNSVYFSSLRLEYNLGDYSSWVFNPDKKEIFKAHYSSISTGETTGYFESFASIMDAYGNYHKNAPAREPSISVKYSGKCDGSVTCNYLPQLYDPNHYYTDKSLGGAPSFSPNTVTTGAMTIKSIKAEETGLQMKWQCTISSNDVENLSEVADLLTKTANIYPITLYAVISSDVPKNNRYNRTVGIRVRKVAAVKSSSEEGAYSIVENTVPEELVDKTVQLFPTEDVVCSPCLDGPVYIKGEYSTEVKWNRPSVYGVEVK